MRLLNFVAMLAALALAAVASLFALAAYYPERYAQLMQTASSLMGQESGANGAADVSDGSPAALSTASDGAAGQTGPAPSEPVSAAPPPPPMPSKEGMVILIRSSLAALNQANASGNYSVLRELSASQFQEVNSTARLSEVFTALRSRNLDLSAIQVLNPRLTEDPFIDDDGRLHLIGFFPSRPQQVMFNLTFAFDNGWRLFGIAVDTRPAEEAEAPEGTSAGPAVTDRPPPAKPPQLNRSPAVPDNETIIALIRDAVLALSQANATGNYAVLREIAAPGFQQVNSHAKLMEIFGDIRRRKLDLSPVTVIPPSLNNPPAIDNRGWLRLDGGFPSRPEQVNFNLAFQKIGEEWKLFGIGVNTSRLVPAGEGAAGPGGGPGAVPSAPGTNSGGAAPAPARVAPPTPRPRP